MWLVGTSNYGHVEDQNAIFKPLIITRVKQSLKLAAHEIIVDPDARADDKKHTQWFYWKLD